MSRAFRLKVALGNEAMVDPHHVAGALRQLARLLENVEWGTEGVRRGIIRDDNGNKVGSWVVDNSDDKETP